MATDREEENRTETAPAGAQASGAARERIITFRARLWTYGIVAVCVLLAALVVTFGVQHWRWHGYEVALTRGQEDTMSATYYAVDGCVLRCSTDGATLTDRQGQVLWDVSYAMEEPACAFRGQTIAIYDRRGSDIVVADRTGQRGEIATSLPIIKAEVSENGSVAVLQENSSDTLIQYYSRDGSEIASIKTAIDNPGYPLDLALSPDGQLIAVSYIAYSGTTQKAIVHVYSFGQAGQNQMDNRIAEFTYSDKVIPELFYMDNNTLAALRSDGFTIYTGSRVVTERRSVTAEGTIRGAVHSDDYIGLVVNAVAASTVGTSGAPAPTTELVLYGKNGQKRTSRKLDFAYQRAEILGNTVSFYNGAVLHVVNTAGALQFAGSVEGDLRDMFAIGAHRYVVVRDASMDVIRLK